VVRANVAYVEARISATLSSPTRYPSRAQGRFDVVQKPDAGSDV
jgi:hypothetical protein